MKPLNLYLLVVPILFCLASPAQKNEISLLNGRFFCTFPDSAKNIARATDIMDADPNTNRETRVIYDIGDKRVVFFAEELYIKSVADLEKRLKEESTKDYPLAIKTIYDKDSAICISMTPSQFDNTQAAIYEGNRRLNLDARTETFAVLGTKTQMLVKLPKDYVVTLDKKYDFEVYRVRKVTSYGEVDHADLNIYYGFHPSFFNTELDLSKFKEADTPGEFMFQKIHWMNFRDDSRQLILREQLFTDDDIQKDAQIHIGMITNNSKLIEEMTDIIKQLLLKYDK